jgi:hypothetical protein
VGGTEGEGGRWLSDKINARETAQHNGGDEGRSTHMGVTAGLSYARARARIDERMTRAKEKTCELQSEVEAGEGKSQHTSLCEYIQQKERTNRMMRGGTQERMVYLTLVSSWAPSSARQAWIGAPPWVRVERKPLFGVSSSGWWASECRGARERKKSTRTTHGDGGPGRTHARRGFLIC